MASAHGTPHASGSEWGGSEVGGGVEQTEIKVHPDLLEELMVAEERSAWGSLDAVLAERELARLSEDDVTVMRIMEKYPGKFVSANAAYKFFKRQAELGKFRVVKKWDGKTCVAVFEPVEQKKKKAARK